MFKTVLFPIDQTLESRHAADLVANIVQTYQSRLIILSVVESAAANSGVDAEMTSPEAIARLLETAKALFQDQGITTDTMERDGKPAFVICDVADELDVDLIIMGSRGVGLMDESSSESVSSRVINLSPCPVLIVP